MTWSVANYNTNPNLNNAINGVDISENCSAAGYNDALRQIMADIATWIATQAISLPLSISNGGTGSSSASAALLALGANQLTPILKTANWTVSDTERGGGIDSLNNSTALTCTINPNGTTPITQGAVYLLMNSSPTPLTISPGSGVTLRVNGSMTSTSATLAQGAVATLKNWYVDIWTITGAGVS